jgi:hypothetical protein
MREFLESMWLFNIDKTTRQVIRLNIDEAALLWIYAKEVPPPATILEIGRFVGGSTVLLSMATHESDKKIISVDLNEGPHNADVDEWLEEYEERDRIDIRVENSHTMKNIPLSLLFVDGDHSYDGIKKDIYHHWNYLNGPCLCHDYMGFENRGVIKFIDEFIEQGYAEKVEQVSSMLVLKKLRDI